MLPFAETITVVRPGAKGKHGDPGTDPDVEFDEDGWYISPGATSETTFQAEQVVADLTGYRESPTALRPTDRVRVRGDLYDVLGKVRIWPTAGVEVDLISHTG